METAQYFNEMFGARIVESVQSDGNPRVDLDLNGLDIFIARCAETPRPAPTTRTRAWTTSACAWRTWTMRRRSCGPRAPSSPPNRTRFAPA